MAVVVHMLWEKNDWVYNQRMRKILEPRCGMVGVARRYMLVRQGS